MRLNMKERGRKYYLFRVILSMLITISVACIFFAIIMGQIGHREIWRITFGAIGFLGFLYALIRHIRLYKAARSK